MPSTARPFEPHITRSGGVPSKYRFTVRCSACPTTDSYETSQAAGDDTVKSYFKSRGWLLGRDRSYDLCPACLARPQDADPRRSSETSRNNAGTRAQHPVRGTAPVGARHKDTADILARHMGKPEALAADVFRPQKAQSPHPAPLDGGRPPVSPPALSPAVEQALIGMAADLTSLRSTMEALVEQVTRLVGTGAQQVEAIARLSPLMIQAADGVSSGLKEIAAAVCAMPGSPIAATEQFSSGDKTDETKDQEVGTEPVPGDVQVASQPSGRARRPKKDKSLVPGKAPDAISVKSIPDPKRPDRFYTAIRLPRELWDSAGFEGDDRLQMDWAGQVLSIIRAAKGGVKPKTVGTAMVALQSWRLGDLNFDQAEITGGDGSLHLTVKPKASRGSTVSSHRDARIERLDRHAKRKGPRSSQNRARSP